MKIIDFEKKGNVVRFYLGRSDLDEYYGDDWNDAPYDCNAGTVYDRYISGYLDVAFPFDAAVLEPCNGAFNCCYTKEDMVAGNVPCIIVVPPKIVADVSWLDYNFDYWVGSKHIVSFYFDTPVKELIQMVEKHGVWHALTLRPVEDNAA